jgi:FixJ family two-component response regulator
MHRILLVDDDGGTVSTLGPLLRFAGYQFAAASTGEEGVQTAQAFHPHVALIDLALPDMSGIEVLHRIREETPSAACVIVTGYGSWAGSIEAMRGGACDWLQKPVFEEDLLAAVKRALAVCSRQKVATIPLPQTHGHADLRLAAKAVEFISSTHDAPTLTAFARTVGVSAGGFRNWCRTAGVRARAYLQLARALRVVYRREHNPSESLENLLAIVDKRTLEKFVAANGGTRDEMPRTVEDLLASQRLVRSKSVAAIRVALAARTTRLVPLDRSAASRESSN